MFPQIDNKISYEASEAAEEKVQALLNAAGVTGEYSLALDTDNLAGQIGRWGSFEKAYGSYDELLEDKEVQAIYIPLPNNLHLEL